jgi:hypothetical protein
MFDGTMMVLIEDLLAFAYQGKKDIVFRCIIGKL